MDQLLLPYLQASDQSERQQHLDELLMVHAAPVVRQALRRRLGFYVDQSGISCECRCLRHTESAAAVCGKAYSALVHARILVTSGAYS
jgi:hypothetical protein